MLAVKMGNSEFHPILMASFSDGSVTSTDSGWKCSVESPQADWNQVGFDDSNWPAAFEFGFHIPKGINPNARWIGANEKEVSPFRKIFCRNHFKVGFQVLV